MHRLKRIIKVTLLVGVAFVQLAFYPLGSYAEGGDTSSVAGSGASDTSSTQASEPSTTQTNTTNTDSKQATSTSAPTADSTTTQSPTSASTSSTDSTNKDRASATTTGPTTPTGTDANTYTFNKATGLWENQYYTWNPTTHITTPKQDLGYSFNTTTGKWETIQWQYDAPSGKYVPRVIAINSVMPAGANNANLVIPHTLLEDGGPDSAANLSEYAKKALELNNANNALANNIASCSTSGAASVSNNNSAGSATSGDSNTMANVLNMLNSSWGNLGNNIYTFNTDIYRNVIGDLHINPAAYGIGAGSTNTVNNTDNRTLQVNNSNDGSIYNKLNLCANSGNADVSFNTNAGSAKSGDANSVANVMNMINSSIESGKSFVGVMNIHGNFEGDILLPDHMLDQLISAAKSAPLATLNTSQVDNKQLLANLSDSKLIENNVNTVAASGAANVETNTHAGSATSGNADTNLTLLNLTGRDVIGNHGLLVFINVLGKWVGVIMDAPVGATSAALGGGIKSNTQLTSTNNTSAELNSSSNNGIKNDISVGARSGDATVSNNTNAGHATSGNATASANILNLIDSRMNLADWFGVLFINVFGNWHGSFGVDTPYGNPAVLRAIAKSGKLPVQDMKVFKFTPSENNQNNIRLENLPLDATNSVKANALLASTSYNGNKLVAQSPQPIAKSTSQNVLKKNVANILGTGGLITLSFLGVDQISNLRQRRRNAQRNKL